MLELRNISKRFGDKQILSDFNLTIHEGNILAIVGPSGGGKTTLLRMLAGLETIDSGEVFYNGEPLALDELTKRQLLGFVFQDFQLFPHLSVLENLTISPVKMNGVPQEEANAKARALLERLGLAGHEDAFPFSLSGGQKQRLSIARAVLKNPPIMILDEATSALDTESEKLVQNALEKMMMNRTSLVIAHRLSTIQKADIIVVMEKGKIIEQGNHATLMAQNGTYRKLVEMQSFQ